MKMMLSPKRLRPRDKVTLIAPASPIMADEVQCGIDILREYGLEPVLGSCVKNLRASGDHAAPLAERVEEFNSAFSDPTTRAVIASVGGVGSAAMLPYLDFAKVRASQKVFLGMSDITALCAGIQSQAGLITILGQSPSIRLDKGKKIQEADTESFRKTIELLMSDETWGTKSFDDINPFFPRTVSPGFASGHVIGGNCDTFTHMLGTKYFTDFDGAILFIEDINKGGDTLMRCFVHMQLAGMMDRVAGIVIGEFADEPKKTAPKVPTIEEAVIEHFSNGVPCSFGYSFSHGPLTSPIPIGSKCFLDADTGEVFFDFKLVT